MNHINTNKDKDFVDRWTQFITGFHIKENPLNA